MKTRTETVIPMQEWDKLVVETYGKPYRFQQQDGCQPRGSFRFTAPSEARDYQNETLPEKVNHELRGVKFSAWLARDPKQRLQIDDKDIREEQWAIDLWWARNFYPEFQTLANDLHAKGLLEAGEYTIDIDW